LIPVLAGKIALILIGLVASWLDATIRKLPNWLCFITLAAGLAVSVWTSGFAILGSHLAHMLIALLVGMVLFRFDLVGGGDAKFYAAIASWFNLSAAAGLLVSVSLSGIVIFLVWFTWRRVRRKPVRPPSPDSNDDKLPYGIAIAVGGIVGYFRMAV